MILAVALTLPDFTYAGIAESKCEIQGKKLALSISSRLLTVHSQAKFNFMPHSFLRSMNSKVFIFHSSCMFFSSGV